MPLRRVRIRLAPVVVALLGAGVVVVPGPGGCAGSRDHWEAGPPPAALDTLSTHKDAEYTCPITDSLASALARPTGTVAPPKNALLLSGGGQYAAYNSGVLVGWSHSGKRPVFDVVTGISSGAIVAAYAFLGERYDAPLQHFFTTVRDRDLFVYRPLTEFFRSGAIASPRKLDEIVEREVNDCFLADLRAAHQQGRRLYVGTMNARTRRLAVWDVGALACSDRPDSAQLVRKVLLAAGSIPGLLPAVQFEVEVNGKKYVEEHCDGGAACQTFLRLPPGAEQPAPGVTGWLAGSNLYAMAAGKLYAPELEGRLGFLTRVTSTISAALYALYRSEVLNLYAFCGVSGMKFHMIAIPEDVPAPANSMTFDPKEMRRLFALGYQAAMNDIPWRLTPPGAEPGEEEHPRDVPAFTPLPRK